MKKERNIGIDLLKIFAMIGVVALHYNNRSIGKAFLYAPLFSNKSYALYFVQSVFICAVNVFIMISGYFMANTTKVNIKKPIRLLIQVVVFRELIYIVTALCAGRQITAPNIFKFLLPQSWFAVLYVALYCLAPYLNRLIKSLSAKNFGIFVNLSFILFSIWPFTVDVLQEWTGMSFSGLSSIALSGSDSGYTLINFILAYLLGAAIRRKGDMGKLWANVTKLLLCWIILFVSAYLLESHGGNSKLIFSYCNPVVILCAVYLLRIFSCIKLRSNPVVTGIAAATFSVYLLNATLIAELFDVEKYVKGNGFLMLLHMAWTCIAVCAMSYLTQLLYDLITKPIYKLLDKWFPNNFCLNAE